ncbi:MAG: hypothetical protein LUO79_05585 [Methanomassiliicoccales archaeon]|nr:hypothetical protein [Methanomassiliicoccales archaeon]
MQGAGKIIALVVVASVALSALSSVINDVHVVPMFNQGGGGETGDASPEGNLIQYASLSKVENDMSFLTEKQLNTTMFVLYGRTGTAYMRSAVLTDYSGGTWTAAGSELAQFVNEAFVTVPDSQGATRTITSVTVSPARTMIGGVPTFKDTYLFRAEGPIEYSQEFGTYSVTRVSDSYLCAYLLTNYDVNALANASSPNDERYLGVPSGISQELADLADFVTQGKNTSYEKAMALRDFLRAGYTYDTKYEKAPTGEDPVLWFLLHGKKGVCSQFNSALTLLARSIGIPARYVTGYVVDPDGNFQIVRLAHAHAYAEIELEGVGWIILDATPFSFTDPFHLEPDSAGWKDDLVTSAEPKNETLARIAGWVSMPSQPGDPWGNYEIPVGGIDLALYRGSELVRVAATDAQGNFWLTDLEWGNYTLVPVLVGWKALGPDRLDLPCHEYTFHVVHFMISPLPSVPPGDQTYPELWCSDLSLQQRTSFHVNGTVRDGSGIAIEGASVLVLVRSAPSGNSIVCGGGTVSGGGFDMQCVVPDGIPTGNLIVTAWAPGNETYAPAVCETTASLYDYGELVLSAPVRIPQGVPVDFHLHLEEKRSGLPIANAVIDLGGIAPNPTTDEGGNATFSLTYASHGVSNVLAMFAGSQFVGACNASIEFSIIALQAEVVTETLVRGEMNLLVGRVYANDIPAVGVNVTLLPLVAGGSAVNNSTNEFGYFFLNVDLPMTGIERGPHEVNMSLADCALANWTMRIKDRPKLETVASGGSAAIVLRGTSSEPLSGAKLEVSAGNKTLMALTDSKGSADVSVPPDSSTVRVTFAGNEEYASAVTEVAMSPAGFDWSFLLWIAGGVCVAGVVAGVAYSRRGAKSDGEDGNPAIIEEIDGPYTIEFPAIEKGFPAKWAQDEELAVAVRGRLEGVRLLVDGSEVAFARVEGETAEGRLLLAPGIHEIRAIGRAGFSMRIVRIVDYREEVARLYHEALEALSSMSPSITRDHTPREVQRLAERETTCVCSEALEVAVSRFEVACFSTHEFGRPGYLDMELAVSGIRAFLGRRGAG